MILGKGNLDGKAEKSYIVTQKARAGREGTKCKLRLHNAIHN